MNSTVNKHTCTTCTAHSDLAGMLDKELDSTRARAAAFYQVSDEVFNHWQHRLSLQWESLLTVGHTPALRHTSAPTTPNARAQWPMNDGLHRITWLLLLRVIVPNCGCSKAAYEKSPAVLQLQKTVNKLTQHNARLQKMVRERTRRGCDHPPCTLQCHFPVVLLHCAVRYHAAPARWPPAARVRASRRARSHCCLKSWTHYPPPRLVPFPCVRC
jgi:hypothetical protein